MYFEQFYLGCLAHASYMLGSGGEAVVVDPQRDVQLYLDAAAQHGLTIRHIFETHLHADFVSGHKELAARAGATIYIGAQAGAKFAHVPVSDGFLLKFGSAHIRVAETPGHTPEGICLLVTNPEEAVDPWAALTGDTLFIGDVGRPDLSKTHTPEQLAGLLYDSLHQRLMTLPDATLVYPAHGAGSLCGKNMRAERSSTIGTERLTNYALQIASREEFVRQLTTNLPTRPDYFLQDAEINRSGAPALEELAKLPALAPAKLATLMATDVVRLDVRAADDFAAGHVPGSVNIGLSGQFASWAGTVLGLNSRIVVIGETSAIIEEARLRLARVGIEKVEGYLEGGVNAWQAAGFPLATTPQITVEELRGRGAALPVLDVRREAEWKAGHLEHATWRALDDFPHGLPALDRAAPVAVHCKGGYRSMIACSLLEKAGFKNVINIRGGIDAWQDAKLPVVSEAGVI